MALCATQGIKEREPERIVERVEVALNAYESAPPSNAQRQRAMIGWLDNLSQRDPREVLQNVKALLKQLGWSVSGPVYQAGGDIHIHGRESNTKTVADHWKVWVGIIVGILTAAILVKQLLFDVPPQAVVRTESSMTPAQPTPSIDRISGIVTDESKPPIPIQGANVVVMGYSDSTVTGPEGAFTLPVHGSNDLVLLNITKDGFRPLTEFYPVRSGVHVVLPQKMKMISFCRKPNALTRCLWVVFLILIQTTPLQEVTAAESSSDETAIKEISAKVNELSAQGRFEQAIPLAQKGC